MHPPRFCKQNDEEIVFKIRALTTLTGLGTCAFLGVWLSFWTIGCVLLLLKALDGEAFFWLFGIPFWTAEIFVGYQLLKLFLFRAKMVLNFEGLTYTETGLRPKNIFIPRDELSKFLLNSAKETEENVGLCVEVRRKNGSKMVLEATRGISAKTIEWIVREGNAFLKRQNGLSASFAAQSLNFETNLNVNSKADSYTNSNMNLNADSDSDTESQVLEEFLISDRITYADQPFESDWTRVEQFAPFEVYRYEKFSRSKFFQTLVFFLFWNGVVSIFVLNLWGFLPYENPPAGWVWWFMFVFLLPFEFIGVVLTCALVRTTAARWVRISWTFERNEIRNAEQVLCFKFRKKWDVSDVCKIQICGEPENCELEFLDSDDEILCCWDSLKLRDARWLAYRFRVGRDR